LHKLARERNFFTRLAGQEAAARAQLCLAQGNLAAAWQWAAARALHPTDEISYPREPEYLTLARMLIAQGRDEPASRSQADALGLLERLLHNAKAYERMSSVIEILTLQALALQAQGNLTAALATLERALTLAEPEGYIRVFLDEGAPMAMLFREVQTHGIAPNYAAKLLAAFDEGAQPLREAAHKGKGAGENDLLSLPLPRSPAPPQADTLSDRELELLRLVAAGYSNQEIAEKLFLAIGTVKKHLNNIFSKLDVQSRTQAIARARELDLL
jgi:LuxR family maltose regulon positive regulatory protein